MRRMTLTLRLPQAVRGKLDTMVGTGLWGATRADVASTLLLERMRDLVVVSEEVQIDGFAPPARDEDDHDDR